MSNSYDIQRRLESQFSRTVHSVSDLTKSVMSQEEGPTMSDLFAFKQALMQQSTANYAASQLTSLRHSLSKSIIDSIN